jgi:predicted Fe-Mo cluster-binding NifX family protein
MTYLIVGLDRHTLAPWHQNVQAEDATAAARVAVGRARDAGVDLVVAAAIGPNSSLVSVSVEPAASAQRAA